MTEIKIEKGIPVPPRYKNRYADVLEKMEVGDCALFPEIDTSLPAIVAGYGKIHWKKFVTRKEGQGRRVWRIA